MFFYAARIFWIFLTPLTFLTLLFGVGLALRIWGRGACLLTATVALFVFLGLFPVGYNLTVWLEKQYTEAPPPISRDIRGIVVLGGIFDTQITEKTGRVSANDQIERIITFIELAKAYPFAQLVFSGGAGQIGGNGLNLKESEDAREFLASMGFDKLRVKYESDSRNTYENARNTKKMVRPDNNEKWIVITSAYHMPRAIGAFKAQGWHVIPYVTDMKTDGEYRFMPNLKVAANFELLDIAVKELIGTFVYYITGKSAVALPVRTDLIFGRVDMDKINIK